MTKATEALLVVFALSAVYFALYSQLIPSPAVFHDEILPFLPFWALVAFGSYALGSLAVGIITFKDKEDKYRELLVQIEEAKDFYKQKGVSLD